MQDRILKAAIIEVVDIYNGFLYDNPLWYGGETASSEQIELGHVQGQVSGVTNLPS